MYFLQWTSATSATSNASWTVGGTDNVAVADMRCNLTRVENGTAQVGIVQTGCSQQPDGRWRCGVDATGLTVGHYWFQCRVQDPSGNWQQPACPVEVIVHDGTPPTCPNGPMPPIKEVWPWPLWDAAAAVCWMAPAQASF